MNKYGFNLKIFLTFYFNTILMKAYCLFGSEQEGGIELAKNRR